MTGKGRPAGRLPALYAAGPTGRAAELHGDVPLRRQCGGDQRREVPLLTHRRMGLADLPVDVRA